MLPTLSISLLAQPGLLPGVRGAQRVSRLAACGQGVSLLSHFTGSCQDSSAAEPVVACARSRAFVQVAFKLVHCPVGDRGEPHGSSENHLRQRPSHKLGSCASCGEATIAACSPRTATLRRSAFYFHLARRQLRRLLFSNRSLRIRSENLRPPTRQGGPPNQERNRAYEERNVGQCLAARGVPDRHR